MHYRPLGATGHRVSEIGMGCNRLGEAHMPDAHWVHLVRRAIELGVTLFDTSESYGWGRSEEILGQAITNHDDVLIASKVSRIQATAQKDFSAGRIIQQAEESLRRLNRECIDIYQLHSPTLAELQSFDWPQAMQTLQQQGKIHVIGVSINDAVSGQWLIEQGIAQLFQIPYNLLQPGIGQELFSSIESHGIAVLVRVPMAQGILTGKFQPGQPVPQGHRALLAGDKMKSLIDEAETYRALAEQAALPVHQFALRYAMSSKAVSCVIPGARNLEQLEQNVEASNGNGLPAEVLTEIETCQRHM